MLSALIQSVIRLYTRLTLQDPNITARESFDFWRSKGAPFFVCWSCLGNEQRETGFNWTAPGDKNKEGVYTAHGICQWHEPRRQDILSGCGIDVNTAGHKGQLAAMYWELEHTGLWKQLLVSRDVEGACDILVRKFERPAQIDRDIKLQVEFANDLRAKHADWETEAVPPMVVTTPTPAPVTPVEKPVAAGLLAVPVAPAVITKAKGAYPTHLTKAGAFTIVQHPCPHFAAAIDANAPRAAVAHTTEGNKAASRWQNTQAAFGVFNQHFAPQFLVGADAQNKPAIYQLVPAGVIGAALRAHNNLAIVQTEIVAFSDEEAWLPDSGTLDAFCSLMLACRDAYGIPLTHPWPDGDFGKYGDNPHRHSGKFGSVAGWFAHGDMPPPDEHWDVGNFEWNKAFARAHELDKAPVA